MDIMVHDPSRRPLEVENRKLVGVVGSEKADFVHGTRTVHDGLP